MPYIGLLPFLHTVEVSYDLLQKVSMPYIGLLPFLPFEGQDSVWNEDGVNALHRASPISTDIQKHVRIPGRNVSMPYIGLLPFLQKLRKKLAILIWCQCPTSGFSHFYTIVLMALYCVIWCQCPTSGFSHFYGRKNERH